MALSVLGKGVKPWLSMKPEVCKPLQSTPLNGSHAQSACAKFSDGHCGLM